MTLDHLAIVMLVLSSVATGIASTAAFQYLKRIVGLESAATRREATLAEVRAALDLSNQIIDDIAFAKEHSPQALRDLAAKLRDSDRLVKLAGPISFQDVSRLPDDLLQELALTAARYVSRHRLIRPEVSALVSAKSEFIAGQLAEDALDARAAALTDIVGQTPAEQLVRVACGTSGVAAVALATRKALEVLK